MVTIGSDPEFFVSQPDGRVVTAIGLVGGTKDNPRKFSIGHIQEDNVLVELNVPPTSHENKFVFNHLTMMRAVKTHLMRRGVNINQAASHTYDFEYLRNMGSQAVRLGCDPDINAWTGYVKGPKRGAVKGLRTASGHVHIGYENPSEDMSLRIAKAADLTLGLPSIQMDSDRTRRQLYGQAGSMRFKPYGLEYRVLSNFWLFGPRLMSWAFKGAVQAYEIAQEPGLLEELIKMRGGDDAIQRAINEYSIQYVQV